MRVLRPGCRMASVRLCVPAPGLLLLGQLAILLLLPFSFTPGACGQKVEVLQSPESVSVAAGEQAALACTVTVPGGFLPGPVKWSKGSGEERTLIYTNQAGEGPFPRISRDSPDSNNDISIKISNISTADAGTYYCVKVDKSTGKEYTSSGGTNLSVNAPPSAPNLTGPTGRLEVGSKAKFTCMSEGFSPRNITVTWLKDGMQIQDPTIEENIGEKSSCFWVNSALTVNLRKEDIRSRLTCQIKHKTTTHPLTATKNMSDILRVSPSVKLQISPARTVLVNTVVNITCSVETFYPQDLNVSIDFPGKDAVTVIPQEHKTLNDDGTYNVRSSLPLNATKQRNQTVFTCKVQHWGKETNSEQDVPLTITDHPPTEDTQGGGNPDQSQFHYYVIGACLALLLLLVLAVVIFMRTKKKRDKDIANRRSMRSSRTAQVPNNKDLTYADLEFQQRPANQHSTVAQNDHCEYASVQTGAQPQKDNLTYADLDTVRLNQGPRKAVARPVEANSEYAEVQIRKQ